MGFSRQGYWCGLPCPPPADISDPGTKPVSLESPTLAGVFFTTSATWHLTAVLLPGKPHGRRSLVGCSPWGRKESDTTERLHFHFLLSCTAEGKMATHSSVVAWRIPGTGDPGGLLSMVSHRVGHDWSNLAAAAVILVFLKWGRVGHVLPYTNLRKFPLWKQKMLQVRLASTNKLNWICLSGEAGFVWVGK